jgi:Predicted Rossmann fold nucleotide-binding protein involved in DNA uptake
MQISEQQKLVIRYSMLSEPGDSLGHLIFENFGPEIALRIFHPTTRKHVAEYLNTFYPEQLGNLPALIERFELRQKDIDLQATIERAIRWGAKPVFFDQLPNLSAKFMDLGHHAPYLLWVAGDSCALENAFVGVVGTREPSAQGLNNTSKLVRLLNRPVVSGGAKGIDAAAHRAALDYGLPTVAFMAGGIDRAYPLDNWSLFHEMVRAGGALVSELAPGTSPTRFRFLQRNRLIAAAASELFVVQAAYRSGSRNTANSARMLGREVFAVPGAWSDKASQGSNAMIQEGLAKPYQLGRSVNLEPTTVRKRVLDAMREGKRGVEEIASESGLRIDEVIAELRGLELDGQSSKPEVGLQAR